MLKKNVCLYCFCFCFCFLFCYVLYSNEIFKTAAILELVTDPNLSDEIFDRFGDYLDVVNENGDLEAGIIIIPL